ncbi:hypothetical protein GCM10009616_08200 [Microlunatus lacustris]
MNRRTREGRPRQDAPSLKLAHPSLDPVDDVLDEIAQHVGGTFVLVVEISSGRYRRRCFLTAAAAEKAASKALAGGHNATVYLAELKPLWRLQGREVGS